MIRTNHRTNLSSGFTRKAIPQTIIGGHQHLAPHPNLLALPRASKPSSGRPSGISQTLRTNHHRRRTPVRSHQDLAPHPNLRALLHVLKGRLVLRTNHHRRRMPVRSHQHLAPHPNLRALPLVSKGKLVFRTNHRRRRKPMRSRERPARRPSLWDLPPDLKKRKIQLTAVAKSVKIRNRWSGVKKNEMRDHLLMIKFYRAQKIILTKIPQLIHDFPIFMMFLGLNYVKRRKTSVHYSSNQHSQ